MLVLSSSSTCPWKEKTMRRPASVSKPLLFLILYLLPSTTVGAQKNVAPDTLALLQFKQQIRKDPIGSISSTWNVNTSDPGGCPATWYGVGCSAQGRVTDIKLDNMGLEGDFGIGTLGSLSELLYLSLSNNSFEDNIPSDLGGLSKITYINLSGNRFGGNIPDSVVNLPSLTNLSLGGNVLNGPIPWNLGMSLIDLDLSRNKLSGVIPATLTQLHNLVALNLSSNSIEGSIPTGFQGLSQLETLDLHGNNLSGVIDPALLMLSKTSFVDLSSNYFDGPLPWTSLSFSAFGMVQVVNLSRNQFSDSLSSFGTLFANKLIVLDVSYNQLFGELPSFQYVTSLTTLRLNANALNGSIPTSILGTSSMLTELDLSGNQLTGSIAAITSGFLVTLNVSRNMLIGPLPASTGPCQSLDLSHNEFDGDLSNMRSWGQTLRVVDLSNNALTGPLTSEDLLQFYQLVTLDLSHNSLSGALPDPLGSSKVLNVIDLSFNQFWGIVPRSLFYSSVISLLLSDNELTGRIPLPDMLGPPSAPVPSLVSPSHLQVLADSSLLSPLVILDLSNNSLNGSVPGSIGDISTLEILNLSANRLSGPIPVQLNGLRYLQDLDLSDNQLSGPMPPQLPKSLTALNVSRNNLSGTIPQNLATDFPPSSFFPGNTALTFLSPPKSSPLPENHRETQSDVKAGLIGGITAGVALVFAICIFFYFYRSSKWHKSAPASEFAGSERGFEFEPDLESGVHNNLPVVAAGKSVNSKRGKTSPGKIVVSETKTGNDTEEGDTGSSDSHLLPTGIGDIPSSEHELVSELSPEHPLDEKGLAPEQLVGDVVFLDRTLSFSAEDLSSAPAEVLGRNNHGTSYKAIIDDDHIIVVKWIRAELARSKKEFGMEAKKFGRVKHQNIVSIRGYYWGPREHEKLILSDFITGVSLASRLQERTEQSLLPLTWSQRLKVAVDVSRGLLYLHTKHGWAHGNIKASNILLTEESNFEARLSDYSLHRIMTSGGVENQVLNSGALGYCAPELTVAKNPRPSLKSDVFSFGVILMELITGKSAGDVVSASTGIVDLPDWVKVVAYEGHVIDCYDTALVGVDRDLEPPKGIEHVLALSLSCAANQSSRPSMKVIHEGLNAINPD